jgi:hypothetical protein
VTHVELQTKLDVGRNDRAIRDIFVVKRPVDRDKKLRLTAQRKKIVRQKREEIRNQFLLQRIPDAVGLGVGNVRFVT